MIAPMIDFSPFCATLFIACSFWLVVFVWRHYNQPLKQAFFKPCFLNCARFSVRYPVVNSGGREIVFQVHYRLFLHAGEASIVRVFEDLLRGEFGKGFFVIELQKDLGLFDAEFERNVFC